MAEIALAALLGALAPAVVRLLLLVPADIDRHNRQITDRDRDLEEWIIYRHRRLIQRFQEIAQQAAAQGVDRGGTIPAGQTAARTLLLYDYREELRQAEAFVREIRVDERTAHRATRRILHNPFRELTTPTRAAPLIDYWQEGTERNALTWRLENVIEELSPTEPASRARAE
jgi:hypothetical protein